MTVSRRGWAHRGEVPQRGPKILEKIWLLLFPKNHKRLVFRIRESQVQWGSDSSQLPLTSISYFLVFACHLIHLPLTRDTSKRRVSSPFFKGRKQSNNADPGQANGPSPLGLGIMTWGVSHHKTKWSREACFLSIMKTQRLKLMTNFWIT